MQLLKDLEDGKTVFGDSGSSLTPPEDFDLAKFNRGREFFKNHLYACTVGMLISLVAGMTVPGLLEALVFTQKSDTPRKALRRYAHTFRHVSIWFYGNVWIKDSLAQQSICDVRKMHQKVREQMQKKYEIGPNLFLSQYDMGLTQNAFMGFTILYPERLGIKCTAEELDDYVYAWYGIGHVLGIQKKYNVCAHGLSQALLYAKAIEQGIMRETLRNPHPDFEKMSHAVVDGLRQRTIFYTLLSRPVILALYSETMTGTCEKLSFEDTVRVLMWKLLTIILRHSSWFRTFVREIFERRVRLVFTKA